MRSIFKNHHIHKTNRLISILWRDPGSLSLEHRIFNTIILMTAAVSLITLIYNLFLDIPPVQTVISLICVVIAITAYYYSIKTRQWRKLTLGLNIVFFIALGIAWFYTAGTFGSVPYYLFILFTAAILLLQAKVRGVFLSVILTAIALMMFTERLWPELIRPYDSESQRYYDVFISLILCLGINGGIVFMVFSHYLKERNHKDVLLAQSIRDREAIEKAMDEIKILRGYLPICCNCKKIRDDSGYWNQIESYISEHSEAEFSHGICPECRHQLYPQL